MATKDLADLLADDLDDGFTELVRVHAASVHAFLWRVSGSAAEADDLGQETLLRAYAALRDYPGERRRELRVRSWLMTIAANIWRNHLRERSRRPRITGAEPADADLPDPAPGPAETAAHREDRRVLVAALARLPEIHRVPVVLRHVAGLSYAELADVLGCPVGTAKAQVSRGMTSLRTLLTESEVMT